MSSPDIASEDIALIHEVLQSSTLSLGAMLDRFEREWCERFGVAHAVAVSSGTAGLHIALIAAGVGEGDNVLTSPFSFVASANAALYERAVPVFVDIDPVTLGMDPDATAEALADIVRGGAHARRWLPRAGARPDRSVKAVLPVHVFGQPAQMRPLVAAAKRHGARVIEDACEAPGAEYEGRFTGTIGDAGVFGFYPNKQLTTGEGGLVTTDNAEWARLLRSLRNQGRDDDATWLNHVRLGYNYRLDEMSAALGITQLRRLDDLLDRRARVAAAYTERLCEMDGVTVPAIAESTSRMSWFVYVIRLAEDVDRERVMAALAADGVPSRPYFSPIHLQPFYRERFGYREGDFPITEALGRSALALPFHGRLPEEHVDYIVSRLADAISQSRSLASRSVTRLEHPHDVATTPDRPW
jgi:dTDP-4-amino-4,6-dideoxygalactose transaminase